METVGVRVRHWRRLRRLTQHGLADKAGLDRRYVGRIETGDVQEPGVEAVQKLAAALAIPIRALANPGWYEDEHGDWVRDMMADPLIRDDVKVTIAEFAEWERSRAKQAE